MKELLKKDVVFFDGAMGTMLQKMRPGKKERSEAVNILAPEVVQAIHEAYVEAGSDMISANTFGAHRDNCERLGKTVEEVVFAAVKSAKAAAGDKVLVGIDIGPTGEILEPYGDLEEDDAIEMFGEIAKAGEDAGCDFAVIETMGSLDEAVAAMKAVKEYTDLPFIVTMTFTKNGRTFMGDTPEAFAEKAKEQGALAIGLNCSLAPADIYPIAEKLAQATDLPLIVKPNAGIPEADGTYKVTPEEFAKQMSEFKKLGVKVVGGCCGTTPEHIKALRKEYGYEG